MSVQATLLTNTNHAHRVVGASVNPVAGSSRPTDQWRTPRRKPRVRFSFERACVGSLRAAGIHWTGLLADTLPAHPSSRGCSGFNPMEPKMTAQIIPFKTPLNRHSRALDAIFQDIRHNRPSKGVSEASVKRLAVLLAKTQPQEGR